MLEILNKVKSKLDRNSNPKHPSGYIGVIDEVSCERVRGWVAYSDKSAIAEPIKIRINERFIELASLSYREDLRTHDIADGYAAFDIEYQDDDSDEIIIEVIVNEDVALTNKLFKGNTSLKNKDPYFIDFFQKSRIKNCTSRLDDGLNIQLIQSSKYESTFASGFFYRINNSKANEGHTFQVGQRLLESVYSNDLIEIRMNANKPLQAKVELLCNNTVLVDSRININPGWGFYEIPLSIYNYSLISKAESIAITFIAGDSTFIDLGALLVRDSSNKFLLKKPKFDTLSVNIEENKIINDKLSNIKISNEYTRLKRKQLIASGVIYEAKSDSGNILSARCSENGIDINVKKLNGYSRISYSMDISAIKTKSIQCVISGKADSKNIIKRAYIYAKGREDKVISKLRLNSNISNGICKWDSILDHDSVYNLFLTTANYHEYRLAIEFGECCEIKELKVSLSQEANFKKEEIFSVIEDSAISSQLDIISGYFDVIKNEKKSNQDNEAKVLKRGVGTVDIVIPVYNAKEFVVECIESIIKYTTVDYRILLLDDFSTDGISAILDEYAEKYDFISVYHHESNVGYTRNVNKGLELSNTEWVLLLNSDTVVTPYWLENMLEATQEENVAIVGPLGNAASWQSVPKVLAEQGGWDFNLLPDGVTPNDIAFQLNINRQSDYAEAGVLNGFCQLINREKFFEAGKLDEIAFPKGYGEENDLCARLIEKGYRLLVCPNSYVFHHKSKSFGHDIRAELSEKGSVALKQKHPNYNWGLVSKQLYNHDVLVTARKIVSPLYNLGEF
ncbi:glycosyltransferase family 2 protein [Vibrio sp. B1FLJ16]|uniref:glycosyltransferase family 2 protein n=1 Tax=Vibrio sp. B1FLJ16 TaxID=2751178 RepID=UPI0015F66B9B|nr:glycosyltransferase [Vibrio sp. B1FLJ16]CAD7807355.1 hypothetical protein ACOMICROBIO_EPCKBFOG_01657 [Vibrio sp. B1FLJ16]CAE6905439.1 hypothetical protein ACOMICROBIO_EPCKBFOG_01657 [Vibrio sp. B1FLJ16]